MTANYPTMKMSELTKLAADRGITFTSKIKKAQLIELLEASDATRPADLFTDGDTYTTAELAAAFNVAARVLRVQLRALGIGVGKGHRYEFSADEARSVAKLYVTDEA